MVVEEIEHYCTTHGLRFTEPRRQVARIIGDASQPIGAYDILARMPKGTKPPTVYRALQFLEQENFIHRIGSLNVYTICRAGHKHQGAQFLICQSCGTIKEVHLCHMPDSLKNTAKDEHFQPEGWFLELHGLCRSCQ